MSDEVIQPLRGLLRQVLPATSEVAYVLPHDRAMAIGRDPRCEILVDANLHVAVSRRHAELRPVIEFNTAIGWQVCDLGSANGTFVNGKRLQGCQDLKHGDRITISQDELEFRFECDCADTPVTSAIAPQPTLLTFTQLIPIVSTGRDLLGKAFLGPGIVTVLSVVLMFAFLGQPRWFNLVLSTYLSSAAYYFIYRLCNKQKPWWVLLGAALSTVLLLRSPILDGFLWVFRELLPGRMPTGPASFLSILLAMFFGAGLMEELLKALPVLAAWFVGDRLKMPWRARVGVREPLDGILLGTASAVGFTLLETLRLYVPGVVQSAGLQAGNEAVGELTGLQLLIPRVLGSVAGHMAYSGYFGYFIGLSVLKPSHRWQILTVGYLSAASLHALWNASATVSFWLLVVVGALSYAFLAASILKAHTLSPQERP